VGQSGVPTGGCIQAAHFPAVRTELEGESAGPGPEGVLIEGRRPATAVTKACMTIVDVQDNFRSGV